jgi:hypothetical protein
MLYHLACMECRAGLADDARGHITRALGLRPELAEQARGDTDLAPVADALGSSVVAGEPEPGGASA